MKTFKIHLIRHGLTEANLNSAYIGNRTDLPLCPEGINELLAEKENIDLPKIEKLYSSPMLRCRQTAAVLYPDTDIHTVDAFTEYDFGEFEGKTGAELEGYQSYIDWTSGKISAPPSGEETTDFIKRLCMGLNETVRDMMESGVTNSAVIMHGGAIMMLLSACAVPRRRSVEWTCAPAHGYSLLITPSLYHSSGIVEVYDVI